MAFSSENLFLSSLNNYNEAGLKCSLGVGVYFSVVADYVLMFHHQFKVRVSLVPLQKILKLKQNFSFTSKNIKKQNIS